MNYKKKKDKLKKILEQNSLLELINYINKNSILSKDFDNFNEILIYAIEKNCPLTIIKYIINQRQDKDLNFYISINNNIKVPLFTAVANNNFQISNLLIDNKADINYKALENTIFDYLLDSKLLITDKILFFILKNNFHKNNFTNKLIIKLIDCKQNEVLEKIFKFYKNVDLNVILNNFLIRIYQNKCPLSNKELEKIILETKRDIEISEELYEHCASYRNVDAIKILFENDISEEKQLFKRIVKYDILEMAIPTKNYDFVEKVIHFKSFYYTYDSNSDTILKNISLSDAISHIIPLIINNNKNIIKLFTETFLNETIYLNENNGMENHFSNHNYDIQYLNYIINLLIKNDNSNFVKYLISNDNYQLSASDINANDIKGNNLIVTALKYGNSDIVKYLLNHGANCNSKDGNDSSLLLLTIENKPSLVKYLLENYHIDLHQKDKWGSYPILKAIQLGKDFIVKKLINYCIEHKISVNINDKDETGNYPLLSAIKKNNILIIKLIIKYASINNIILDINAKDNKGNTPLLIASKYNNMNIFELLLDYSIKNNIKLNINETNIDKDYPFLVMVNKNNISMIKSLMDYSTANNIILNVNEKNQNNNYPLISALLNNNVSIIKLLISYCNINHISLNIIEKNTHLYNPLELAIYTNNVDIVQLIIDYINEHNINFYEDEKKNKFNYNLLQTAIKRNNIDIIKILIDYANKWKLRIDINTKCPDGNNLILEMIRKNKTDIVKILIDYANNHDIIIDVNEQDFRKNNPILMSIYRNNIELAKTIINYANSHNMILNINEMSSSGNYPLLAAIEYNNKEMVSTLIDYANNHHIELIIKNSKNQLLNENGASVYIKNESGYSPLDYAVFHENKDLIDCLYDKGLKIENISPKALQWTIRNQNVHLLKKFINDNMNSTEEKSYEELLQYVDKFIQNNIPILNKESEHRAKRIKH
ncbi:hypothetical protein PIROE2DRAFT_15370 [Piromyces sp. E2]|nr:hypothetical protein PIROE2DRAFT_15370 [Piromyces sp. E2]|eukprot:OUM59174.1 hypothetical protein PIROE2DRAFT_15370 [Piromyces sp. E2]